MAPPCILYPMKSQTTGNPTQAYSTLTILYPTTTLPQPIPGPTFTTLTHIQLYSTLPYIFYTTHTYILLYPPLRQLKVLTDILPAVDAGDLSALVLLDLSAAFDTIDHGILLRRLDSFLSDRGISTTMVSILPVKPATARASRIFLLITRLHGVWCTPRFRPWCHTFPSVEV